LLLQFRTEKIDKTLALAAAAVHDIGNMIDRKFHNQYGSGAVMGHLTAEDLIRIPTKDCLQMLFLLSDTLFRSMARHMLLLIMKIFLFLKKKLWALC